MSEAMLRTVGLAKSFTLHLQGGVRLPVLHGIDLALHAGECVVLCGPSGAGKSTLLRSLHGNYRAEAGQILIRHAGREVDLAAADPRTVLEMRRHTLGYVSQFLRVIPRVAALDVAAEPLIARGVALDRARDQARVLLDRLNVPRHLHGLPPATFSGGEQQRVNLARGFVAGHPVLLLDEPTASLDTVNRDVVIALIREAKGRGVAILAIVHDDDIRRAIADRSYPMTPLPALMSPERTSRFTLGSEPPP